MAENRMRNTYAIHYHSCEATDLPALQKVQVCIVVSPSQHPGLDSQEDEGNKRPPPKQPRGDASPGGSSQPDYLLQSFPNQALPAAGC